MDDLSERLKESPVNWESLEKDLKGRGLDSLNQEQVEALSAQVAQKTKEEEENKLEDGAEDHVKVAKLHVAACLVLSWQSKAGEPKDAPRAVATLARWCHRELFNMGETKEVQRKICRVCEFWWSHEMDDREQLVTHSLPMLLILALDDDAKKQDVKRVFNVRKMLSLLDLDDDSSVTLKQLLLRCFLSPLFLVTDEGSKFLSELFLLSSDFLSDIHATVKAQLPYAAREEENGGLVDKYAQVYFRGWKTATQLAPALASVIEREMVQDLMDAAVHVADEHLADALLEFLNRSFHDNKNAKEVDALLLRLYNPILWRSLSAANPTVRFNATRILGRAFPLHDPEAPVAESDELLQKQYTAIETLLLDTSPKVRVAAVQCACRMLSVYWELIPKKATVSMISILVGQVLHDKSSPKVRVAVLKGLEFISENPLSQGALKDVLVHCSPFIHDQSKSVRNALVSLLLRVKSIRSIKFYDVVTVDHLLERLATDSLLAGKLTKLLADSFFPQGVSGSEQLRRILSLIEDHPRAAVAFTENLHRHLATGPVCKLALLLGKWMVSQVGKLGDKGDNETLVQVFCGAMKAVATLWFSVSKSLATARYKSARQQMMDAFSFESFVKPMLSIPGPVSADILPYLLEITAQLPCDENFQQSVLEDVLNFDTKVTLENYRTVPTELIEEELSRLATSLGPRLYCLSIWGAEEALCENILASLTDLENPGQGTKRRKPNPRGKKTTKAKGKAKDDIAGCSPFVALWCLQYLLANNPNGSRDRLLSEESTFFADLTHALEKCAHIPFAFETSLKLAMHKALAIAKNEALLPEDDEQAQGDATSSAAVSLQASLNSAIEALSSLEDAAQVPQTKGKKRASKAKSVESGDEERLAAALLVVVNEACALRLTDEKAKTTFTDCWNFIGQHLAKEYHGAACRLLERCGDIVDRPPVFGSC